MVLTNNYIIEFYTGVLVKYFIAIPTYNGGEVWHKTVDAIKKNAPADVLVQIIDSGSTDNTVAIAKGAGFYVQNISSAEFNHGDTRNRLVELHASDYDVVIFLTQDAIPQKGFIENIIKAFEDPMVACAYGRQLPHLDANPIAQHARFFNYPESSHVSELSSAERIGIKAVFMSNSFSAYRISTFYEVGKFPSGTILCEDMFFTAKALQAGYKSAYCGEAKVRHSHNYTGIEEFKRYFDIGVFHAQEPWIQLQFGKAKGEGVKFLFSELRYTFSKNPLGILTVFKNNFFKLTGYKLGMKYRLLPMCLTKRISMHKRYWN